MPVIFAAEIEHVIAQMEHPPPQFTQHGIHNKLLHHEASPFRRKKSLNIK
jgi:hypothetical protein